MAFSKKFPRKIEGSNYPVWEEVFLTDEEEHEQEITCRKENIELMKECVKDARQIMGGEELKDFQSDLINMAISLFEKRASHSIYWKERMAKEKFHKLFSI